MNRRMLYGMIFLLVCLLGGAVSYYYFYSSKPAIPVLYPIETGKRWGFIDKAGKTVVFPAYDYARRFSDGLGAVSMGSWENSRWGFVDAAGTLVIPVRYSYVSSFKEGVAFACEGKYPVWKCGLINHKGEYITPERFDGYGEFSDGLAPVKVAGDMKKWNDGLWGFVDRTGKIVIEIKLTPEQIGEDLSGERPPVSAFAEGVAPLKDASGQWGYIDQAGKYVISPQFAAARKFSEGIAAVAIGTGPELLWGYLDRSGKMVIQPQFTVAEEFQEGLALVSTGQDFAKRLYGFIDKNGAYVIQPSLGSYQVVRNPHSGAGHFVKFKSGLVSVAVLNDPKRWNEAKWGYMDRQGVYVIQPQFLAAYDVEDGIAFVVHPGNKSGYIDKTGKSIWIQQ